MTKLYNAAGVVCLLGLSVALAGGGAPPRKEDMPKYLQMLKAGPTSKDKAVAAEMIGKRGAVNYADVEPAIEPLKKLLKDNDAGVRKAAVTALGVIKPEGKDTVPALTDVVKNDKVFNVKLAAAHALGLYGAEAKAAVPAIRALTADVKDKKLGKEVQGILQMITGKKKG